MKILLKILLPVLLIAAAGLFGSTLYTYERSMVTLKENNTALQKMAVANALVELKAGLDFNILNAISLSQTGILQPYLTEDLQTRQEYSHDVNTRIINMRNTYYYKRLGVVSPTGIILDHTEPSFIGRSVADKKFFQEAMQGKIGISAPHKDFFSETVVYAVASPVYNLRNNEIVGVVYNVSAITDTMSERMLLGDSGYLFVADQDGNMFIHKDEELVFNDNLKDCDWGRTILKNKKGSISFTLDGHKMLARYDILPESNWIAVAVRDLDDISATSDRVRQQVMFFAIAILFLLGFIIYYYVKYIIDALLKAVHYAEQISQGALDKDLDLNQEKQYSMHQLVVFFQKILHTFSSKKHAQHTDNAKQDCTSLTRNDEIGVLYTALQRMVRSMRRMVTKANDANRMKSEFLANMSHEIRTPLHAILGFSHLWLTSQEDDTKKRDYVQKIESSAKNLLGIINNVLDTSKIEAGMFELDIIHFNLQDVITQALDMHRENATQKNIELNYYQDKNLPIFYNGDAIRLGQIINNLVDNAIKFTEKGSVTIYYKDGTNFVDKAEIPAGTVPICLQVKDTGIGITSEQEELLFNTFSQADTSITRRFGGIGLGLAISRHIIHLMGGNLQVQSAFGQGTTFNVILFLNAAEEKKIQIAHDVEDDIAAHINLQNKRILVVEDNMINQCIMEEILIKTHAHIEMAENGQIAVDLVQKEHFDLILMDVQMPILDGIEATKIIRQTHDATTLPIIAVTANAMKEDKEKGIAAGFNDYLTKPVDPKNLMLVLYHWLCE